MAITNGYASVSDVQRWLGVAGGDPVTIELVVETASRAIDDLCGRRFWQDAAPSSRRYGAASVSADRSTMSVDDIATTAGLAVAVDEDGDGTFETTVPLSQVELRPLDGVVRGVSGWPYSEIVALDRLWPVSSRRALVQVTARWGWPAVPEQVRQACLIAVADLWKLRDAPWGVAGFGDYGAVRIRENPEVVRLLRPFMSRAAVA